MNRSLLTLAIASSCILAIAIPGPAAAAEPSAVRIAITVENADDSGEPRSRTFELMAPIKGHAAVSLGHRVPIAAESAPPTGGVPIPTATKVSYQDIGFSARLETRPEDDGKLRISGRIEVSSVASPPPDRPDMNPTPVVAALTQNFDIRVVDGTTIRLLGIDDTSATDTTIFLRASLVQ